jgi:hypothetical protein
MGLVPSVFAEKAMGSLMQLHTELMEEKGRRVDLYRRLMEKEQAVAELRMYVKLLEERLAPKPAASAPAPVAAPVAAAAPVTVPSPKPAPAPAPAPAVAAAPARVPPPKAHKVPDGWRTW